MEEYNNKAMITHNSPIAMQTQNQMKYWKWTVYFYSQVCKSNQDSLCNDHSKVLITTGHTTFWIVRPLRLLLLLLSATEAVEESVRRTKGRNARRRMQNVLCFLQHVKKKNLTSAVVLPTIYLWRQRPLLHPKIAEDARSTLLEQFAVSVQYSRMSETNYSRMRHLWPHLVFSGLCNIVVCTTYDFLQKPAIVQKFKMADLDSFHILKWHNILHCFSKVLYSESK